MSLYRNIKKKRDRIKVGAKEKMRKAGDAGAPSAQDFANAAKTAKRSDTKGKVEVLTASILTAGVLAMSRIKNRG